MGCVQLRKGQPDSIVKVSSYDPPLFTRCGDAPGFFFLKDSPHSHRDHRGEKQLSVINYLLSVVVFVKRLTRGYRFRY